MEEDKTGGDISEKEETKEGKTDGAMTGTRRQNRGGKTSTNRRSQE